MFDKCVVGSEVCLHAAGSATHRWFTAEIKGRVPSAGKPLLLLQVGDDLRSRFVYPSASVFFRDWDLAVICSEGTMEAG